MAGKAWRVCLVCGHAAPRALLGLFVLAQLLFLLAANLAALGETAARRIPRAPPALHSSLERVEEHIVENMRSVRKTVRPWAEMTAQPQSWSLFAPNLAEIIPFVGVELRWDDGRTPLFLPSENEPADPGNFFKVGRFRLRRFESTIDVTPPLHNNVVDTSAADWNECISDAVASHASGMRAYLSWRLAAFLRTHADLPTPSEVRLCIHLYRIPPPPGPHPWHWEDLGQYPIARWRPGSSTVEVCPAPNQQPNERGKAVP